MPASGLYQASGARLRSSPPPASPQAAPRSPLSTARKKDGSVTFFTPVPEGSEVVVMDSGTGPATGYAGALAAAYKASRRPPPHFSTITRC